MAECPTTPPHQYRLVQCDKKEKHTDHDHSCRWARLKSKCKQEDHPESRQVNQRVDRERK